MSFEAESNSELTVIVQVYQLHFRFSVQNKIHKQKMLFDTRTGILGSIAGPCDFLSDDPTNFKKFAVVEMKIVIYWSESNSWIYLFSTYYFFSSILRFLTKMGRQVCRKTSAHRDDWDVWNMILLFQGD